MLFGTMFCCAIVFSRLECAHSIKFMTACTYYSRVCSNQGALSFVCDFSLSTIPYSLTGRLGLNEDSFQCHL